MSLFRYLPAAIMSAVTMNPTPLLAQAGGEAVTQATGSPTAGRVASIAGGNIADPSNIAPTLIKEAGTTALEKTGPTGQAISTGISVGSALKDVTTSPEQAIKPSGTSSFKQALPYLALAGPALASLAKTGKVTPGLEAGSKLLQGMSAIQSMEVQQAQEKDRATKAGIEIKNLQAEDAILSKNRDPRMSLLYKNSTPSQKAILDEKIDLYADDNGMIDGRTQKQLLADTKYDVDFNKTLNDAANLDNKADAESSHKKYQNAVEKFGADSVEAKTTEKEYLKKASRYDETKADGNRHIDLLRKREAAVAKGKEGAGDIVSWVTPKGETINLQKGTMPPEGSTKAPTISKRENISDTDDMYEKKKASFIEKNKRQPKPSEDEALYQSAADTVKRQSPEKAGEVTAQKEEQKNLANAFNIAMEEGIPAQGNKWRIQEARKVIESGKAYTGKLSPLRKWVAEYASALTGKSMEGLPETEMLTAIANRSALLLVGASQGKEGGMPANLFSEADREFVVASTFNPTQTDEGILRLMNISEKAEDYRLTKSKVFRKYKKEHDNKLDSGVYDELTKEMQKLYPTTDIEGGTEQTITMPDGSVRTFDATGKRIK